MLQHHPAVLATLIGVGCGYIVQIYLRIKSLTVGILVGLFTVVFGWAGLYWDKNPAGWWFFPMGILLGIGLYYLLLRVGFIEWFITNPPDEAKNS